jgi:hypothetical protein
MGRFDSLFTQAQTFLANGSPDSVSRRREFELTEGEEVEFQVGEVHNYDAVSDLCKRHGGRVRMSPLRSSNAVIVTVSFLDQNKFYSGIRLGVLGGVVIALIAFAVHRIVYTMT